MQGYLFRGWIESALAGLELNYIRRACHSSFLALVFEVTRLDI